MKFVRFVLITAGVLLFLLLIAVGLAANSRIQTWAARRALANRPELKASIGLLDVGFDRVRLERVQMTRNGAVLTVPSANIEAPLFLGRTPERPDQTPGRERMDARSHARCTGSCGATRRAASR